MDRKYTLNELNLMSYQELRRLSILLRLPANIKKKYMIKMIAADQKNDHKTKESIANLVMEERKVRRFNQQIKKGKSLMLSARSSTQQLPTDLSISTKHEFETRYSYVAHYTAKQNTASGISEILKEEAEVSRRNNRGIIHQTRKATRKLSTLGKTEIMLPRNHSLTTPVRLMPQHERNFLTQNNVIQTSGDSNWNNSIQYESVSPPSESETHFQEGNTYTFGNLPISAEYTNFLASSTSHELCRSQPYWHTRESYNNSTTVPPLASLLTPSSTITNSSDASPSNSKSVTTFQGAFEKYIPYSVTKKDSYESSQGKEDLVNVEISTHNEDLGNYVSSQNEENFQMNHPSSIDDNHHHQQQQQHEPDSCQQYRDDSVIRHTNPSQSGNQAQPCLVDIYLPRSENSQLSYNPNSMYIAPEVELYEDRNENRQGLQDESQVWEKEDGYILNEGDTQQSESKSLRISDADGESYALQIAEGSDSYSSDMSIVSSCPDKEIDSSKDEMRYQDQGKLSNSSKCRYTFGHNQYPDFTNKSPEETEPLPPFFTIFSTINHNFREYSTCKSSFTGTTGTHLYPIMTSNQISNYNLYPSMRSWDAQDTDNGLQSVQEGSNNANGNVHLFPRWLYTFQEPQSPYGMEGNGYASSWNDYTENMNGKLLVRNEVQVFPCNRHGYHMHHLPGPE